MTEKLIPPVGSATNEKSKLEKQMVEFAEKAKNVETLKSLLAALNMLKKKGQDPVKALQKAFKR